ncbi:MAG: hypothetical protein JST80_07250 [Bdellovibrionales bacterium]|nr:hypothetical protein [Bdellovibrionales bacterium]
MLIHSGSVKEILHAGPDSSDELIFKFTDRYSVFDWGQMPDLIPGKGLALAKMGRLFFEELNRAGIKNHYVGPGESEEQFRVRKIEVPRGREEVYQSKPVWTLVPLEVIYRFGVPKGSSLLKRSSEYCEGQEFSEPIIDFTTKLERVDRVLTHEEARKLSGMSEGEWTSLLELTAAIGKLLRTQFDKVGLKLWDGKFEFAFGARQGADREIILVDTIGLDEMRLTFEGQTLSKEILRQFYLNTEWHEVLTRTKKEDPIRFKERCIDEFKLTPGHLARDVILSVAAIYTAVAEMLEDPKKAKFAHESIRLAQQTIAEELEQTRGGA